MTENSVVIKKTIYLKNQEIRSDPKVTNSKLRVHKAENLSVGVGTKLKSPSRFRCWACGLSRGEVELCQYCKTYTKSRSIVDVN